MNWLEIIELRAIYIDQHVLHQQIVRLLDEIKDESALKVYVNVRVETDWSIHVQHESEQVAARGSEFGRRLKEILKEWGLVNRGIWYERTIKSDDD